MSNFVIISEARSGTNLLLSLLNSHPEIKCFGEIFCGNAPTRGRSVDFLKYSNKEYHWEDFQLKTNPVNYLEKTIFSNEGTVGFKIFQNHFVNLKYKNKFVDYIQRNLKVIHMHRENLLDRLVSHALAAKIYEFMNTPAGFGEAYAVDNKKYNNQSLYIDCGVMINMINRSVKFQEYVVKKFNCLSISYEQLIAKQTETCTEIQRFLGVQPQLLVSHTKKQREKSKSELISNYSDLKKKTKQLFPDYLIYFDE